MNMYDAAEAAYKRGYEDALKEKKVIPVDEIISFRNKLYDADRITMGGLREINELLSRFSERS